MRYFRVVEHLFAKFIDTDEIRIIHDAIEALQSDTFSVPNLAKRASIYGAIACGVNIYLNSHVDADFTYSATSIHCRGEYSTVSPILGYFAFPRLGVAIPLRSGDILFFNPNEPHCVSSRVSHSDDVYCVSLYLKRDNIGKNDNSIALTSEEQQLLHYYHNKNVFQHKNT
jgi:hypothetical protein